MESLKQREYTAPELEILDFDCEDIVTASNETIPRASGAADQQDIDNGLTKDRGY